MLTNRRNPEIIHKFFGKLEQEIVNSIDNDCATLVQLDANAKVGKDIIKNDPNEMSKNGQLLWDIVERRNLFIVNSSEKCKGLITRSRETIAGKEESIIDYVIVCDRLEPFINKMEIDDKSVKVLTKIISKNGVKSLKTSDHNIITCSFSVQVPKRQQERTEVYNLRNKEKLKEFKDKTTKTNQFTESLKSEVNESVRELGKKWNNVINSVIRENFQKFRVKKIRDR